jgi:ectoine hydroxylase-related dioxygenase (phytanoyl-CoA dioxygenase family)
LISREKELAIMSTASQPAVDAGIRAVTADEVAFYRENGWVKLERLMAPELAAEILARAKQRMGDRANAEMSDDRAAIMTPQLRALWNDWQNPSDADDFFRSVSQSPGMGRLASRLLRDRDVRWWSDMILCKLPSEEGGSRTPWHQDFPYLSLDRIGLLNVWVALVDMPPEMGTMRFVSGSQRIGPMGRVIHRTDGKDLLDLYPWIGEEHEISEPLQLKAGDATVHDWMTVHAAPPNDTDQPRWVYVNSIFPAETLFTGAQQRRTDGLELKLNEPLDHPRFPVIAR